MLDNQLLIIKNPTTYLFHVPYLPSFLSLCLYDPTTMKLNSLTAISPIDGRYRKQVEPLAPYFSEFGLIRYRIKIEVEYFIALCELPLPQLKGFDKSLYGQLRGLYQNFDEADALRIKAIEATTNHDVKAVEYFIKEKLEDQQLGAFLEFIHFGLTSQDINNTCIPLLLKRSPARANCTHVQPRNRPSQTPG